MEASKYVYKVVSRCAFTGRWTSARMGSIHYEIDKFAEPTNDTKLFCFETFEDAQNFRRDEEVIFYAYAEGLSRPTGTPKYILDVAEFWNYRRAKKKVKIIDLIPPPNGTLFARRIKILKEIYL